MLPSLFEWGIAQNLTSVSKLQYTSARTNVTHTSIALCVLDSMCPCLYVSISLCVQGSMWQISCRIDPLWLWFYVSRVLCGPGSMWPLMYKLTLCVVGPMCPGSNVTNALCVQGSMCPWLYVAIVYMLLYSNPNQEKVFGGTVLPNKT